MIQINKSSDIPEILITDGIDATQALCNLYDSNPASFQSQPNTSNNEVRKMEFDTSIYGHPDIKNQLKLEQYDKCCFCENKFSASSFGDVEHFRPKAAVKMPDETKYQYPGYYWLAYDWNNLFFSCERCNRSYKKNNFPLVSEAQRMRSHHDQANIEQENPLLIHPANEDATQFIQFRKEIAYAVDGNKKGKETINLLHLNRRHLCDKRLELFEELEGILYLANIDLNDEKLLAKILDTLPESAEELFIKTIIRAKQLFNNAAKAHSPFAGMVRSNFPHLPYQTTT